MEDRPQSRRVLHLASLSFPGGLPLGLVLVTLPAWLADQGVSATEIGLVGAAGLPWSFKFLWAPLLDRFAPPLLDRRRAFMVLAQIGLFFSIAALSLVPAQRTTIVLVVALAIALSSATQDIAMDAYAVEVLRPSEYGPASGLRTTFYRLAMLVSGGAAIALADQIPWSVVFLLVAFLFVPATALTSFAPPAPPSSDQAPAGLVQAIAQPIRALARGPRFLAVAAFVLLYKFGDAAALGMVSPFFRVGLGVSLTEIGFLQKTVGLIAIIAGTMTGGVLLPRLGLLRGLFVFGVFQALTSLLYAATAFSGGTRAIMYAAIICEQAASGMATAALLSLMMSVCEKRWAATQFALLSSLMGVGRTLATMASGALADLLGYGGFFVLAAALGLPGLALIMALPRPPPEPTEATEATEA